MRWAIDTHLRLNIADIGPAASAEIKQELTRSNPRFFKAQRMGHWTGNIPREVRSHTVEDGWLRVPRGVREMVNRILAENGRVLGKGWDRTVAPPAAGLKLRRNLWEYQREAVDAVVSAGGGIVRGQCGSGKTAVLLAAIAKIDLPAVVVVHSDALMQQWILRVGEWLGVVAGRIGGGRKPQIRPVTIAMQQTVCRLTGREPWIRDFGVLVGDEIHHWAAKTFLRTAEMFPARWRVGASADERRKDGMEFLIHETFGPTVHVIEKAAVRLAGRTVPMRLEVVMTEHDDPTYLDEVDAGVPPDWVGMVNRLTEDRVRERLIFDHVVRVLRENKSSRVLVLTERVAAAERLVAMLREHIGQAGRMVGGQANRAEMDDAINGLRDGSLRVGVGTTVADEGLDIPALTHVFVTCPMHTHPKRLEQMSGRASRTYPGKSEGVCVYFLDPIFESGPFSVPRADFLARLGKAVGAEKIEVVS